jgi:hypothetical protein
MQKTVRPFWLLETRDFLAIMLVIAMIGLLFVLTLRPTAIPDTPVTNIVIGGFMTVGFSAVIQFYFGSSKGSVAKDDTINAMAEATPAVVPAVVSAPIVRPAPIPVPQPSAPPNQQANPPR